MNKPATDFNDLARIHGKEAVRSTIASARPATPATHQAGEENMAARDAKTVAAAIDKLSNDVGAALEPDVLDAWRRLKQEAPPDYARLRRRAKQTNSAFSITQLDKLTAISGGDSEHTAIDLLVSLARDACELFHNADKDGYALIRQSDHSEIWPVKSKGFSEWIRSAYYHEHDCGVSDTTLKAAVETIAAIAIHDGEEHAIHLRCAKHDGGYLIDLCNARWQVVHVTASGWRVLDHAPARFYRNTHMRPLPDPERGGDLGALWMAVNISEADRVAVLAWLIECFRPDTSFPVLELVSEQGAGKSETQKRLRDLVDPNKVALRAHPKTVEDTFVSASNGWLLSYENLSHLSAEQQDALCTISTGGGMATRQFFTNGEESVIEVKRPIVLNGIAIIATRPDLIDRTLHIDLPTIESDKRREDADLNVEWEKAKAGVFGGLLDLFSKSLATIPGISLPEKPRMADFARLGEAVSCALGNKAGAFLNYYQTMQAEAIDRALDGNSVALALDEFLNPRRPSVLAKDFCAFSGTVKTLWEELKHGTITDAGNFPRSPKGLADSLRQLAAPYRQKGVAIKFMKRSREGVPLIISFLPRVNIENPSSQRSQGTHKDPAREHGEHGEHDFLSQHNGENKGSGAVRA